VAATDRPTPKQLAFLRELAVRRGETFANPQNRAQASREIKRLLGREASHRAEARSDGDAVTGTERARLDAARVRDDEIEGRGSSATWRGARAAS
jgi:hypothetical protein